MEALRSSHGVMSNKPLQPTGFAGSRAARRSADLDHTCEEPHDEQA